MESPHADTSLNLNTIIATYLAHLTSACAKAAKASVSQSLADAIGLNKPDSQFQRFIQKYLKQLASEVYWTRTLLHATTRLPTRDLYVPLTLKNTSFVIDNAVFPLVFSRGNHVLVLGTGGAGKSMLSKATALSSLLEGERLPVYIKMRDIADDIGTHPLFSICHAHLSEIAPISEAALQSMALAGLICFILDGFDELPTDVQKRAYDALNRLCAMYPASRVLVTSRPHARAMSLSFFLIPLEIQPCTLKQQKQIINRLPLQPDRKQLVLAALEGEPHRKLGPTRIPLLLIVFALTVSTHGKPPSDYLHTLYAQMFDAVWSRHDQTKDGIFERPRETSLPFDLFQEVLAIISYQAYLDSLISFTRPQLESYVRNAIEWLGVGHLASPESYIKELSEWLCIIYWDGSAFEYLHRSFQEYYVAYAITKVSHDLIEDLRSTLNARADEDLVVDFVRLLAPSIFYREFALPAIAAIIPPNLAFDDPAEVLKAYADRVVYARARGRPGTLTAVPGGGFQLLASVLRRHGYDVEPLPALELATLVLGIESSLSLPKEGHISTRSGWVRRDATSDDYVLSMRTGEESLITALAPAFRSAIDAVWKPVLDRYGRVRREIETQLSMSDAKARLGVRIRGHRQRLA